MKVEIQCLPMDCLVMCADRRAVGSTEFMFLLNTDKPYEKVCVLPYSQNDDGSALPLGMMVLEKYSSEVVRSVHQGKYQLVELLSAGTPVPYPVVSLSGVVWSRQAALEANQAICAFQREAGLIW